MKKTNKTVSKRIRITKTGKVIKGALGKGHYQSKLTGRKKQGKRKLSGLNVSDTKRIIRYLPHN